MISLKEIMANFHFLRPDWLYMLIPLMGLLIYMSKHKLGSRSWKAICDQNLLPYILIGKPGSKHYGGVFLIAMSGLLAILALAGPAWQQIPQAVYKDQTALVIALDLSHSMDATDIKPNRLTRARFKIADILNLRKEGQTALLVYANDAYVVTPLTDDTKTISSQLSALTTDIMPVQGNNTALAVEKASELLKQAGLTSGDVLLVTDEINFENSRKAVLNLIKQGYRLSVLGIGTEAGEPIPLAEGGFLKDSQGAIVIPTYDDTGPRQLAREGQGIYQSLTVGDTDIKAILKTIKVVRTTDKTVASQFKSDIWQEQGPWLLLLLIPLVALSFRRGYLVVIIIFLLPMPEPAYAFDWQGLWLRSDQQAARALEQGDTTRAAKLFSDPGWKAAAQYQAGDFTSAIETLNPAEDAESLYNKGNALAQTGKYKEAIAAYDKALELMPENKDAQYNRDLIKQELEKQQNQKGKQSDKNRQGQQQKQQNKKAGQSKENNQGRQQESQQSGKNQKDQKQKQGQEQSEESQQGQQKQQQNQKAEQSKENQSEENQSRQAQKQQPENKQGDSKQASIAESKLDEQAQEQAQATEQWLRRIPDDPAGLLRRKFLYQYQQRDAGQPQENQSW